MGSLGKVGKGSKVHNNKANLSAKVELRRQALAAVSNSHVFDAFAGPGAMFRAVWKDAISYVGCDERWYADERKVFVADNRNALRALDLRPFTIFDLDAFGSPWEQIEIIAHRRRLKAYEMMALILTEGFGVTMAGGGLPKALARMADLSHRQSGLIAAKDEIQSRALRKAAELMKADIVRIARACRPSGQRMTYSLVVLRGHGE